MGSGQKIAEGRIARFLKVSAFIVVPLVAMGAVSIFFQWTQNDREFGLYDFDLGSLWPWSERNTPENEVRAQDPGPVIGRAQRSLSEQKKPEPAVIVEEIRSVSRRVKIVKSPQVPLPEVNRNEFQPLSVQQLDIPLYFMTGISKRFMELSKRENLIPKDLENKRGVFAVGASFAPSFTYRNLRFNGPSGNQGKQNNQVLVQGQSERYRDRYDAAILNFYSGIDLYWQPRARLTLQTGLYYASYGEQLRVTPLSEQDAAHAVFATPSGDPFYGEQTLFNSPEQPASGTETEDIPFNNYYGFLEIPLMFSCKVADMGSTGLEIQAGMAYSMLIQTDALLYNYHSQAYCWISEPDFAYLNRHFLQAGSGLLFTQYFSRDVELFANPQFRYSLTPTFRDTYEIRQNQTAFGLRLGMKVHL